MGLGTYLGYFVSQNGRGHVLGHVKDVGDDATQIDKVRIYRTTARQFFHADDSDIVGLLCLHRAQEGGESDLVSVHAVWNQLQKQYPSVARTLTEPIWYFDRKGETSVGQEEYIKTSIFYIEPTGKGRVYCKWDPYYVKSLTRFSSKGIIPALSEAQVDALETLEKVCNELALHMILEVGDIQFLSNAHILHARTAYKGTSPIFTSSLPSFPHVSALQNIHLENQNTCRKIRRRLTIPRPPTPNPAPPPPPPLAQHPGRRRRLGPPHARQQREETRWHTGKRHTPTRNTRRRIRTTRPHAVCIPILHDSREWRDRRRRMAMAMGIV